MRPIHKRPDGGFLRAAAALLFLAACAWGGAGLYVRLRLRPAGADETFSPAPLRLTGIALREEEPLLLPEGALPLAEDGTRLSAGGLLARLPGGEELRSERACLVLSGCDGLERLRAPEEATVPAVRALLNAAPRETAGCRARLVYGYAWYYAALAPADAAPGAPGRCRLRFSGQREWLPARLVAVSAEEDGQRALLFRLDRGEDCLRLRRVEAELWAET